VEAAFAAAGRAIPADLRPCVLANAEADGASMRVPDLRVVKRVMMIVAGGSRSERYEQMLCERIGADVRGPSGWQFQDSAAERATIEQAIKAGAAVPDALGKAALRDVDGLVLVRLQSLAARTTHRSGESRCLTSLPFTPVDKPTEPKRSGYRKDDHYARACEEYREALEKWYEQQRVMRDIQCDWRQDLLTTQQATVRAQVDICDRQGGVLASLTTDTEHAVPQVSTRTVQVRGWGVRPEPLRVPPDTESVPETVESEAVQLAGAQGARMLLLRGVFPSDAGVPAATPGAIGPEPSRPGEWLALVEAEGAAPLAGDEAAAAAAARQDAVRIAIEKTLGVFVTSETLVSKSALVKDLVSARTQGFAAVRREIGRRVADGMLRVTCSVEVRQVPLRRAAIESGLVRAARVMVVVPEQHLTRRVPDPAVETALIHDFLEAGLKVVDAKHSKELRERNADLAHIAGNRKLADELRQTYGAEILVTGEAFSQRAGDVLGQPNCAARAEIKSYDLSSAELISANAAQGSQTDQTEELAAKAALGKMGSRLSQEIVDRLLKYLQPRQDARRLQLTVRGFAGLSASEDFSEALAKMPGVATVRQVEFKEGLVVYEVEATGDAAGKLGRFIERDASMKEFKVRITSVNGTALEAKIAP
jgi:hypothetical protein